MKKMFALILAVVLLLCACAPAGQHAGETIAVGGSDVIDFVTSAFKHITNGGVTDDENLPYNIDAITGATMTVEGPAIVTSIPLSIRELENRSEGFFRGIYTDSKGTFAYEGMDLYYLLHNMTEGDNGIHMTDTAYKVVLKSSSRLDVAEFTLAEIIQAHNEGNPILLACGMGTTDGRVIAPFVFDAANENEHSLGYKTELDNDDGCIRLVYDLEKYGSNEDYTTFANVAYVYVCEEKEPGFKHTAAENESYNSSRYNDYIISFRGSALGREMNFTLKELEAMVVYDENGEVIPGGVGYSNHYSLANTTYWYVNEYEGLDLYKMLLYLGMDDAETMGLAAARTTLVKFIAADGMAAAETFSIDTLSWPDAFGFYEKNAADLGDGTYKPTNADLVQTGYPVLLAYGVNNYPYTIHKTDDAYLSGLNNSGGPIRVVFGKTQYYHANGSNQVQYLKDVVVGEDILYSTHTYTDNADHKALAQNILNVTVYSEGGQTLLERKLTVEDVENVIYGPEVPGNQKKAAHLKDSYEVSGEVDCYEGVDLNYLLMNILGLPGTNGTVTFSNGEEELTLTIAELFAEGYNTQLGREGMKSVLAFAKNGSPLVAAPNAAGYVESVALNPYLDTDPAVYHVDNWGGPLQVIVPSSDKDVCNAKVLSNVTSITVNLIPDAYAHIEAPYDELAGSTIRFYGEGLDQERVFTVEQLESMQTKVHTLDFSVLNNKGNMSQQRYRGLAIYELFTQIGIKSNAGQVIVYAADGSSVTFSLSRLKKQDNRNYVTDEEGLYALLAFGAGRVEDDAMTGVPLVREKNDAGYNENIGNNGGPLKLVIPQENAEDINSSLCVKDVVAVEVTANEIDTWSHRMSDIYSEFLDYEMTLTIKNDDSEWSHNFTVGQLEQLKDLIVRDEYTVLDIGTCEGIDIWKFIQLIAGDVPGVDDPVAVTVYASDGYKNDLLSVFFREGLVNGVSGDTGDPKKLIIAYALNGYPLVDEQTHEGYTGLAGNASGPLRVVAETNQGASVKFFNKLVVTISGSGPIDITVDESIFAEEG